MAIKSILLNGFRNHKIFQDIIPKGFVVIHGPNGIGKTNILEAISLFSPGKGFRNARIEDIFNSDSQHLNEWRAIIGVSFNDDELNITTSAKIDYNKISKRILKVNDEYLQRSSELLNYLKVIWITPQTDRVFLDPPNIRRKFFDRVTYNFFPTHATDVTNYEKLMKSRLKIIQEVKYDEIWVSAIEKQLSELNFSIYNRRKECLKLINKSLERSAGEFLKPKLSFINDIDAILTPDIDPIYAIGEQLKKKRRIDALSGRTNFGIHKIDIEAYHPTKNIKAQYCSTGEQKAMLISIILAQIHAIKLISSTPVVLLLDEIFSHFDQNFRMNLMEELSTLEAQVWITTASSQIISEIPYAKHLINLS